PKSQVELVSKESRKRPKGISSSYEVNLQKKDGTIIPVIVAATSITTPEGEFDGTIAVLTNIVERKQAEEEIRKERDLAQKYLDTAGVMMLAIEADQTISLINKKGCEILGYKEKEILGLNWFDNFIPQRLQAEVKEVFNKLIAGEVELVKYFENPIVTIGGEEKIIGWYNTILKDKTGRITGTLSSGEDISERKKAERIRKELEEHRENFIYMTTHELRTPLTVIGGYCDFLSEHDKFIDRPRREKIYSILKSNVNRLERLTQDVSHIVQLERGEFLIEKEEIKVCPFLKLILEQYYHLLGPQFSFKACSKELPVIIQADPDRLQQVMENVISNAIKHTPKDKREIIVSTEILVDKVRILVQDNGAGIASEHLETIFGQFITIPTDYAATGTGIGLYLSREIIKAHNGTITAQSKGKGQGSTFTIELPRKLD
ncbi:MAG: ATP-binding protein, partial [Promethearchaeota archaeon]